MSRTLSGGLTDLQHYLLGMDIRKLVKFFMIRQIRDSVDNNQHHFYGKKILTYCKAYITWCLVNITKADAPRGLSSCGNRRWPVHKEE